MNNDTDLKSKNTGVSDRDLSPSLISEEAKKKRRSEYMKTYRKNYKSSHKRVRLSFSIDEFKRVKSFADEKDKPIATTLKTICLTEIDKTIYRPEEGSIRVILTELKRLGNNVNQVAHRVNYNQVASQADVNQVRFQLQEIKKVVQENMAIDLVTEVEKALPDNEKLFEQLEAVLSAFKLSKEI